MQACPDLDRHYLLYIKKRNNFKKKKNVVKEPYLR